MNNVDIAIHKVRELQTMIYDHSVSNHNLFQKTQEVLNFMQLASEEIKANYEDISEKLTRQMNTGRKQ